MIVAILNFIILLVSIFIMSYVYIPSIQPMKMSEKYGDKAWNYAKILRSIGGIFELVSVINIILWIWFPLPFVFTWIVSPNIWIGIIISICLFIPCGILVGLGVKSAGPETLTPSKETEMYGGIYKYIRHPQSLGEFPMFIALGFLVNSWFLVIFSGLFIVIYIPIMIHYEEKDLIRRFGDKYIEYQQKTGALFPKFGNLIKEERVSK
ncbi:MAG: isoprenylcysteine carboxylmethyltransferase family protein [Candidatus Lokiarchaeota archaeon]